MLVELLTTQRDYLTDLYTDYDRYFNALIETGSDGRALIDTVNEISGYISERVLWIRSTDPIGPDELKPAGEAIGWLTDGGRWAALASGLWAGARREPAFTILGVLGAVLICLAAWRSRRALRRIADRVTSADDRFALTLEALAPTVLLALPVPVIFWLATWRLAASEGGDLAGPLATALSGTGILVFTMELIRQFVRPGGIGEVHFRWKAAALAPLRRHLPWLTLTLTPLALLLVVTERAPDRTYGDSLGRFAYFAFMIALSVALAMIFRRRRTEAEASRSSTDGWRARLRLIWYPLVVMTPLAFVVLAGMGYYYSALQLDRRLVLTLWLALAVMVLNALVRRWLYVARRTLVLAQRRRRRAEAEAARAESDAAPGGEADKATEELPNVETESPELDLYTINVQTQKLLSTALTVVSAVGLYLIWANILPALGYLDRVTLWSDGDDVITLANLAGAIVIGLLTVVAARNVPGLLEIVALQRLPFEPGVRFAITTVVRYTVTIVGLILTFGAIGIGWSKVQWLAAAVTVGLGFGLQEIFANFVSGLIILFEQPIRVGDIVTVGDTTGVVSRIRIRATTITDWDRKEFIVPNREFVTGRMLNWTLSDKVNRVTVPVGVAYGSDTVKARELLGKIARENGNVLEDPAPLITFEAFGDSTLNLVLRAYIPSMDNRLKTITELHEAIDREFKAAGIEIAFPQRDLHIRSFDGPVPFARRREREGEAPSA